MFDTYILHIVELFGSLLDAWISATVQFSHCNSSSNELHTSMWNCRIPVLGEKVIKVHLKRHSIWQNCQWPGIWSYDFHRPLVAQCRPFSKLFSPSITVVSSIVLQRKRPTLQIMDLCFAPSYLYLVDPEFWVLRARDMFDNSRAEFTGPGAESLNDSLEWSIWISRPGQALRRGPGWIHVLFSAVSAFF